MKVHYHKRGTSTAHRSPSGRIYKYRPPPANHPLLLTAPKIHFVSGASTANVDNRSKMLPVRDQGKEGACSGFTASAYREGAHAFATGQLLPGYLSPAYAYARTRMLEGTFPRDAGASIADEFTVLQNHGVCPEEFLPYNEDPSEAPTSACDVAAASFRIPAPHVVDWTNQDTVKQVLQKQNIAIGFTVFQSFEDPRSDGTVRMFDPSEPVLGGHGVLVVGCNDYGWIIRNHWATGWADAGYCYQPYGYESCWTEAITGDPAA